MLNTIISNAVSQRKCTTDDLIATLMSAARVLWKMSEATDCQVRAYARQVAIAYHDREAAGEDAGIRNYIECLPPGMALEYHIALTLSTLPRRACIIHDATMYVQADGRLGHEVCYNDGTRWVCHGGE